MLRSIGMLRSIAHHCKPETGRVPAKAFNLLFYPMIDLIQDIPVDIPKVVVSEGDYRKALSAYDVAICEAYAVSQAQANRLSKPHIAYASYIFARLCAHGVSLIRAAPYSRWVKAEYEHWDFGAVAGHARAIFEGYLTFTYLTQSTSNDAELEARIYVMHLNEVTRRAKLQKDIGASDNTLELFAKRKEKLQEELIKNKYFQTLPLSVQKSCLSGQKMMMLSRDQLIGSVTEQKKSHFDGLYDLWSQYTHILPLSFFRMEPNGRGTGMENDTDRSYITFTLDVCTQILTLATDILVQIFPDTGAVRLGISSTFSPGPRSNRPKPASSQKNKLHEEKSPPSNPKVLATILSQMWDETGGNK